MFGRAIECQKESFMDFYACDLVNDESDVSMRAERWNHCNNFHFNSNRTTSLKCFSNEEKKIRFLENKHSLCECCMVFFIVTSSIAFDHYSTAWFWYTPYSVQPSLYLLPLRAPTCVNKINPTSCVGAYYFDRVTKTMRTFRRRCFELPSRACVRSVLRAE